jgi:hypothetical protein
MIPVNWYAVVKTGPASIETYLTTFELLKDPQLLPFQQDGQKLGKLIYSKFAGYEDYEGVLNEARELISMLTGTMRISQDPEPLSILNIIGVFEDGTVKKFPPFGRARKGTFSLLGLTIKPGARPRATIEQHMLEHIIRSGDPLVKDVLRYMSSSPDFFGLYKVLEVIGWDLGKGSKSKGYRLIRERKWVDKKKLKDFRLTADSTYRHWDKNHPTPKMDLQDARIIFRRILEEWIAERAGVQLPPVSVRPGWHP